MKIVMILLLFLLTGYSANLEEFDTTPGKGVGAKSISQVNQMVEEGAIEAAVADLLTIKPILLKKCISN